MKRLFNIALGVVFIMLVAGITTQLNAQVYGEFDTVRVVSSLYNQLPTPDNENGVVILPKLSFVKIGGGEVDPDDGYALINIGFDFEFNGEVYNKVWINVNGFITFGKKENNVVSQPPFLAPKDQEGLFLDANSYPVNVISPFWGDHYYRDIEDKTAAGFMESEIKYLANGEKLIIEWKNLNINYRYDNKNLKNSVANFQVVLFKSSDTYSRQGDIEFHYGVVGGNPYLTGTDDDRINTKGCAIGMKGEGKMVGDDADYLNAFVNDMFLIAHPAIPYYEVTRSRALSNNWPPTDPLKEAKYFFKAMKRFNVEEWWGDGDVDYSKAPGNKDYNFGYPLQNRFVTVNDARLILKSIAQEKPLDPIRRRSAYHGDVNHNGRYYYDAFGVKKNIFTKSDYYADDLPAEVSSVKQILFEVTEFDAALILGYMAAKIPTLPWMLDTMLIVGKVNPEVAELNINYNVESLGNGYYTLPVYANSTVNGPLSVRFNLDAEIISVNTSLMNTYNNGTLVLAGNDEFDSNSPIATITVKTDNNEIFVSELRVNDLQKSSKKLALNNTSVDDVNVVLTQNPIVNDNASIIANINANGSYTLSIYDMLGNEINVLFNGNLESGVYNFSLNTALLSNGAYFYNLTGNGKTLTGKVIVNK
jgi:hypothetical protein